jgi:hypothetical protein
MNHPSALALLALSACEPEPPPTIDEIDWSAASGVAELRLEQGLILLDGHPVGELREPGVLRQSKHRKLRRALAMRSGQDPDSHDPPEQALLSRGWPARLELAPETPWDDVYPLIATAAWVGFGPFELVEQGEGGRTVGPLGTDTRQPAAWAGEPILGLEPVLELELGLEQRCDRLRFEVRVEAEGSEPMDRLRQLPQVLRSIGSAPLVDCAALFDGQPEAHAACAQAQGAPVEGQAEAPPTIPTGQRGLVVAPFAQGVEGRGILAPAGDVPVSVVLDAVGELTTSGAPPVIALTKPGTSQDISCQQAKLLTPHGVLLAGARWLGEHHQPLR